MLRAEVVESPDWAEMLGDRWRELVLQDSAATPFQTLEWQSTWFKYFGRNKKPRIWTLYEGEDLIGLMPFVRVPSPWRALRPMGCGPSDYLQPIARPRFEETVARRLAGFVMEEAKARLVDLHQIRETLPLAQALAALDLGTDSIVQATCLVLELPQTYDAYLATLGKSLRYDVKRLEKPPFSDGSARIEDVREDRAAEGVDFFLEAHKKRWSKRGLPGAFLGARIRDFHREWATIAARNGWLWMGMLDVEGKGVGAIYAMRFGSACYFYQSGFDPAYASISPGSLLVAHTIKRAIDEGLTTFDFLRGDEPYKRRWKPQHAYRNLRFLLGEDSLMPQLGKKWNRAGSRVESKIRERFEGKSLRG